MTKIKLRKSRSIIFKIYPSEAIFYEWLEENIHRFNHKPVLQEKREGQVVFSFEGIIHNIVLGISFNYPEASLYFDNLLEFCDEKDGTFFDMQYIEYIGEEKYHPQKGYYDADRIDGIYNYYPTQKELYINNVFEPIIEYCNKIFISENSLELLKMGCGSTAGCIRATEKIESEALDFIDKFQDVAGVTVWKYKDGYTKYKYDLFCT